VSTATATKARPIMFSAPMIRALLAGRKTQTRRIAKFSNIPGDVPTHVVEPYPGEWIAWWAHPKSDPKEVLAFSQQEYKPGAGIKCPYGAAGDSLYVKEVFWPAFKRTGTSNGCVYRADYLPPTQLDPQVANQKKVWRSPIFMPRWASRITLEITAVRVERVQDITEADVEREGAFGVRDNLWGWENWEGGCWETPQLAYQYLFDSINGKGSWAANPWCWCIEFAAVAGAGTR
jgi:hypothetical protein